MNIGKTKMRIKSVSRKSNFEALILDENTVSTKVVLLNTQT
jgi:hypothetical protein